MSTFRSEPMVRGTMVLPSSLPIAHEILERIGRLGAVQFVDMQANALVRPYNNYIQRIEEMERIIRFLQEEIRCLEGGPGAARAAAAAAAGAGGGAAATAARHEGSLVVVAPEGEKSFLDNGHGYVLDKVEEALSRLYGQFVLFKGNNTNMQQEKNSALEEQCVLNVAVQQLRQGGAAAAVRGPLSGAAAPGDEGFLDGEDGHTLLQQQQQQPLPLQQQMSLEEGLSLGLGVPMGKNVPVSAVSAVAGVIATEDISRYQRTLFRSTRGNAFSFFQSIEQPFTDPKTGQQVHRSVFVVYHQGSCQSLLHEKIKKVAEAFNGQCYEWPQTFREAEDRLQALSDVIKDKEKALAAYEYYFLGEISTLLEVPREGGSSLIEEWRMFCSKEKAIYAALNCFEGHDMTLRCTCWIPKKNEEKVRSILRSMEMEGEDQGSAFLLTEKHLPAAMPPTYFKSTEFTDPSQMLVDTYGVPRYEEANPAFLTSVTFPFLFGVMYGDIGHGGIVFLLGLYLMLFNNRIKLGGGMFSSFLPFRYMLTLMGFFAFYVGFLYNDVFALGVDIFGSKWTEEGAEDLNGSIRMKQVGEDPYPFGIDPAWKGATNELLMTNSIKMKLSVLVAVVHMGVGVIMKGLNALHFNDMLDFFFEFIPQFVFLTVLIGYMNFMVVYKWVTPLTHNKPNLISAIINMCMMGEVKPEDQLYANQQTVERVLLLLIVLTVPVMLLVKPTILVMRKKRADKEAAAAAAKKEQELPQQLLEAGEGAAAASAAAALQQQQHHHQDDQHEGGKDDHEGAGAGDLYIFQMIETIEFVLGTISNTASYLRLWALSLAHQQLSLVFYSQTVVRALELSDNTALVSVVLFFVFALFAFITFGVILCMDLLEVALHALRLQWVEFQNKFFKGDGHKFAPLDFMVVVQAKPSG